MLPVWDVPPLYQRIHNYRRVTHKVEHTKHSTKRKSGALWVHRAIFLHCENCAALWVGVTLKRGESREGNKENMENKNGKHANSDTRGGERKLGPTALQCIRT